MKILDIYDFDNTLFHSPLNTKENRELFEKVTGIPWEVSKTLAKELTQTTGKVVGQRRGWYGRIETLLPPLVPEVVSHDMWIQPTVESFLQSKNNPETITVIMTGRHLGIRNRIYQLLKEYDLVDVIQKGPSYVNKDANVTCLFFNEDGPYVPNFRNKPNETFDWKVWIIEKYLDLFPELTHVNIWEDRIEHVKKFLELKDCISQTLTVNHVGG